MRYTTLEMASMLIKNKHMNFASHDFHGDEVTCRYGFLKKCGESSFGIVIRYFDGKETFLELTNGVADRNGCLDWLWEEVVDWTRVEVDTKIEVWDVHRGWIPRHFAKYDNHDEPIIAWVDGKTSHTTKKVNRWEKGRLVKED